MKIYKSHEMKEFSNMKVGGSAKELVVIEEKSEIVEVLKERERVFVIGNGTNTLLSDKFMDMTFISLKKLQKVEDLGDGLVRAEAGIDFEDFVEYMKENDYSGLENLAGIPGSLGGLVYMNGGAYGTEIFDCIQEVEIVDENNEIKTLKRDEIHFTYRKTEIQQKKWIVLSATFRFQKGYDGEKVEELKGKRGNNHPLDLPNLGSTFKNPEGHYSARLIIEAGMQGKRVGGAQISMVHPNFIVNHGEAKASDIKELIAEVKKEVKKNSGIDLEEEIIVVGE